MSLVDLREIARRLEDAGVGVPVSIGLRDGRFRLDPWTRPQVRRLEAGSAEAGGRRGFPDAGYGRDS